MDYYYSNNEKSKPMERGLFGFPSSQFKRNFFYLFFCWVHFSVWNLIYHDFQYYLITIVLLSLIIFFFPFIFQTLHGSSNFLGLCFFTSKFAFLGLWFHELYNQLLFAFLVASIIIYQILGLFLVLPTQK